MGDTQTLVADQWLHHSTHRAALTYWQTQCRQTNGIPGRQDIDPTDIPGILPWVNLIDVHRLPEGLRFKHRLVGTEIVKMRKRDATGQWLHDLYSPETLARFQRVLGRIVCSGEPELIISDLSETGKPHRKLHALVLPLASDHRRVDMLLGISQYE